MKNIRKLAKEAHKKILDEDTFLEDVLLPMVKESSCERTTYQKRIKKAVLISTPLLAIVIIISVVLGILLTPVDTSYFGQAVTKNSDVATLNECLIHTQINGEFDLIIATYNDETLKYYLFDAKKELMTEDALIYFSMTAHIDRDFPCAVGLAEFENIIDFLGYSLEFTENIAEELYEGVPVNEFTVKALLDTGNECFYISYREISTNDVSKFTEFISNTIIKK